MTDLDLMFPPFRNRERLLGRREVAADRLKAIAADLRHWLRQGGPIYQWMLVPAAEEAQRCIDLISEVGPLKGGRPLVWVSTAGLADEIQRATEEAVVDLDYGRAVERAAAERVVAAVTAADEKLSELGLHHPPILEDEAAVRDCLERGVIKRKRVAGR